MDLLANISPPREDMNDYYVDSCCPLTPSYKSEPCTNISQYGMGCDCKRSPDCTSRRCGGTPDLCFSSNGKRHIEPFRHRVTKRTHPYEFTKGSGKHSSCPCVTVASVNPYLSGPI